MSTVDARVREKIASEGTASVIVVCDGSCDPVVEALRKSGITVDERALSMGSVAARLDGAALSLAEKVEGVVAIELDDEVSSF